MDERLDVTTAVNRRGALRRTEDCLALLEAAVALGATHVTARVHAAVRSRLPEITEGMAIDAAVAIAAATAATEEAAEARPGERRVQHRRPAFDHQILLGDLFPWRP